MALSHKTSPERRAAEQAKYLTGFVWHAGTYVIINVFFWVLDSWGPGGVNWFYWITLFWGVALAFHALAYWVDGREMEEQKTQEFLHRRRKARTRTH